jgi:multiple sugar transport system permease protein
MNFTSATGRGQTRPRPFLNLSPIRLSRKARANLVAYAFLLPGLTFMLVWLAYPMARALQISLYDWQLLPGATSDFLGLGNYLAALADPLFWSSMANTARYALVTVAGQIILGLAVALMLDRVTRGRVAFRVVYYLPVVTSWVVVSLLFKYLFNSSPAGLVNHVLVNLLPVLPEPVPWLNEPGTAFIALYCLGIWKGVGWTMVIILAALQSIPEECYAAASIDGASGRQILAFITLPLLLPTLILVLIMLTIGAFQTYIPVALVTGGGPLHRTEVALSYMYGQAFNDLRFGYSAALSYILAAIVFAISQAQLRLIRRESSLYG